MKKFHTNQAIKFFCLAAFIIAFESIVGKGHSLKVFVLTMIIFCVIDVLSISQRIKKDTKILADVQAKGKALSNQIASVRKVICEGQASRKFSITKLSAGWLVLTEDALEYYELKEYQRGGNVAILIDDIVGTSVKGKELVNTLVVSTKENTYSFVTHKAQIWKEQIDKTVAN